MSEPQQHRRSIDLSLVVFAVFILSFVGLISLSCAILDRRDLTDYQAIVLVILILSGTSLVLGFFYTITRLNDAD